MKQYPSIIQNTLKKQSISLVYDTIFLHLGTK